ncbi:excisionase family DNA-binding protein [Actinotalea ferrariae]|uniref:excisionase family DNA-binding protein n=1 Tax=Actinotalea ferrariae TaxID=1386098 RepID=UPI0005555D36|nr:excisionase family DNA-binding protein [Actinotalea ferrariae]
MSTTITPFGQPGATPDDPVAAVDAPQAHYNTEKLLISVEEAAERLDIGRTLLFELIRTDQIRTIRVGRLRKVPVESLHEFVERQRR